MKYINIITLLCIGSINIIIVCMHTNKQLCTHTSDALYISVLRNYITHGLPVPSPLMKKLEPKHYKDVYQHNQKLDMQYAQQNK